MGYVHSILQKVEPFIDPHAKLNIKIIHQSTRIMTLEDCLSQTCEHSYKLDLGMNLPLIMSQPAQK